MSEDLPEPLTPPDCDVRDKPIPWEFFEAMARVQFGLGEEEARALTNEVRTKIEAEGRNVTH